MCLNGFAAIWWRIMCYNEPDWNETMDLQSRLTGQCVTARHRSAEHENRTTKAEMSVNNEHKCNKKSNQWELISLTCSFRVRCACVNMSVKKKCTCVFVSRALGTPGAWIHMSCWSEMYTIRADCTPLLSLIQSIGREKKHSCWDKFSTWYTDTEEHWVGGNLLLAP